MQRGAVSRSDASVSNDNATICGITEKIAWNGNNWKQNVCLISMISVIFHLKTINVMGYVLTILIVLTLLGRPTMEGRVICRNTMA